MEVIYNNNGNARAKHPRARSEEYFVPLVDGSDDDRYHYNIQLNDGDDDNCGNDESYRHRQIQSIAYTADHDTPCSPRLQRKQQHQQLSRKFSRELSDEEFYLTMNNTHYLPIHYAAEPANLQSLVDKQNNDKIDDHAQRSRKLKSSDRYSPLSFTNASNSHIIHGSSNSSVQDRTSVANFAGFGNRSCALPFRRTIVFTAKWKSTFSFAVTAVCIIGFYLYSKSRSSLRITVSEVNDLVAYSAKIHRQLRSAEHEMKLLERELAALDAIEKKSEDEEIEEKVLSQSSAFANPDLINEMNAVQQNLKISQLQSDKLKVQVSEISKHDAIQKYGSGTIRIRMDLIFNDPTVPGRNSEEFNSNMRNFNNGNSHVASIDEGDTGPHIIVIEMASLEIMPHSVFTFLEMVSNQLLDGCSFILNALHVIKAAPLPYDGTSASRMARQFLDHGLESVAFREYSSAFPHERYTVGFAADGSPSFYINTDDNSDIHVGDPCFAKVVLGFDTIERLQKMPTRNGIWFEHRIGIKQVTIL